MKKLLVLATFLTSLLYSKCLWSKNKWVELSIGAGLGIAENDRLGNTAKYFTGRFSIEPRPLVVFRLGPIAFSSEGAGLAVVFFENFKIIGTVFYEGEPYNADGLLFERKRSIFTGGVIQFYHLLIMGFQDIQSRSNGKILKVISKPEFRLTDKWTFSPRMFFQYWDEKYVDYYYGVLPDEVDLSIGRTVYPGKETFNYGFMLRNIFKVGSLKYLFSAGIKYYGEGVRNSPTVTDKKEYRLNFGVILDLI